MDQNLVEGASYLLILCESLSTTKRSPLGANDNDCGSTSEAAVARAESAILLGGGQCKGRPNIVEIL